MITDEYIEGCVTQLVFNKFSTRTECMNMPLVDFIRFYENLADEAERVRKEVERVNGK